MIRYIWCMPYISTIITLLITIFSFSALISSSTATPQGKGKRAHKVSELSQLTRLRADQPVIVQQGVRGGFELRYANVNVTNVGSAVATGIHIHIEQAGGVAYSLRGPAKLQPKERGLYVLSRKVVATPRAWNVIARCSNCRR